MIEPEPDERELLWAAALLHDIGMSIGYDSHPEHAHYHDRLAVWSLGRRISERASGRRLVVSP